MSLPKSMKAVKNTAQGKAEVVADEPLPEIRDGYILVKVSHVALNPTDWKHVDLFPCVGATIGCDFSGTVAAVGKNLSKPWSVGERVAGLVHGGKRDNLQSGSFAEYCLVKAHQAMRVPDGVGDAEAATLGVAVVTLAMVYQMLNLPWPDQVGKTRPPGSILIYGGSTASGLFGIQMARLSGLRVLTTCSPRNFDTVRALGADEAFDYHDADACAAAIRAATDDQLLLAFDAVAEGSSTKICAGALTSAPGRASYAANQPFQMPRTPDDVWQSWLYAYTTFGESFTDFGADWPAKPDDESYAARFWLLVERLVGQGKIKFFPQTRANGLSEEGILAGLDELRQSKVSAGKLVYSVA